MTAPVFWRCVQCRLTGIGDLGATRHASRPPYHLPETTTRRAVFTRWQKESDDESSSLRR